MIWFVVFHPRHPEHWWARRFGHVSMLGFEDGTYVHVDLRRAGVEVETFYRHDDIQNMLSYFLTHHTLVKFGPALGPGRVFGAPMTCVQLVKHTLGLKTRALLPDGLFRILTTQFKAEVMPHATKTAERDGRATQRA